MIEENSLRIKPRILERLASHKGMILQSAREDELDALLPSVLDRAFKR
jgi:hypothetical protein